jgi:hypothetical protein
MCIAGMTNRMMQKLQGEEDIYESDIEQDDEYN